MSALQKQLLNMPVVKAPYLPPLNQDSQNFVNKANPEGRFASSRRYTLVLDLDETLIHYVDSGKSEGSFFLIRPFCMQFLKEMSEFYELVIFTAGV